MPCSLAHTPPISGIPGAINVCLLPVVALSSSAQAGRQAGSASQGPARANRKDLFLLGFYFSYKQWPSLPVSDFPPAFTWHWRKRGWGQVEDTGEPCPGGCQHLGSRGTGVPVHVMVLWNSIFPPQGALSCCGPALLGVTTPYVLSYLSSHKSWVCTPGNSCFGLARASSSSSSSSLQVAGARPDLCSCDGTEAGEGEMGSAAAGCARTLISALWTQVPEAGGCLGCLKIELAWVEGGGGVLEGMQLLCQHRAWCCFKGRL